MLQIECMFLDALGVSDRRSAFACHKNEEVVILFRLASQVREVKPEACDLIYSLADMISDFHSEHDVFLIFF